MPYRAMRSLAIALLLAGCAHDVHVAYPALSTENTGTIVLLMSEPASGVSVAVNGVLVVEDAHTARVVIDRAPIGNDDIVLAANGGDKAMRVWVGGDHATTVPMGVPEGGAAGFLKTIFASIITVAVYALLHR
jgi:hypothetical protein